ncbi:MAG: ankyrin repeat domain-containing protein [Desulfobulbaceae bacterium]|nr:ankyrin repeat domain-containing protein [Desulfobulbaceae bacterium]
MNAAVRLHDMMMKKVILIACLIGLIMGWFSKTIGKEYEVADIYRDLRNKILSLDPAKIGLSPSASNRVWGVLMETGYKDAVATLVTIADGTVSLYFSNGGGIIGVGEHDGPRKACDSFLSMAPKYIEHAKITKKFSLPKEGNTRFYFLTHDGIFTVQYNEDDLGNERVPLSPLFLEAHKVITQARIVDDHLRASFQNLMHAVTTGDLSGVKKFLEEGADPNRTDNTGLSPLMAAAYSGKFEVMKTLIEYRSKIDDKDTSGYSALIFASNTGHVDCTKFLIEKGADVNTKDNDGSTPIMFASQHGYNELVKLLLKNGADPTIIGNHGLSAIGFAKQNGHKETEQILQRK